jgi:DNA (cytosine-5)-methyltransferase 1
VFIVAVDAEMHIPVRLTTGAPAPPFHSKATYDACKRQRDPIWWRLPIPPLQNATFADVIENAPTGVAGHTEAETRRLIEMMAAVHLAKIEAAKGAGRRMVGGVYKRMRDEVGGRVQRAEVRFDDIADASGFQPAG